MPKKLLVLQTLCVFALVKCLKMTSFSSNGLSVAEKLRLDLSSESKLIASTLNEAQNFIFSNEVKAPDMDYRIFLQSKILRRLQGAIDRWMTHEDTLRDAVIADSYQQVQLFDDAIISLANSKALLGFVYWKTNQHSIALQLLEGSCPLLWEYQAIVRSPDIYNWLDCYIVLKDLYVKIGMDGAAELEKTFVSRFPWVPTAVADSSSSSMRLRPRSLLSEMLTLSRTDLVTLSFETRRGWSVVEELRSLLASSVSDLVKAKSKSLKTDIFSRAQSTVLDIVKKFQSETTLFDIEMAFNMDKVFVDSWLSPVDSERLKADFLLDFSKLLSLKRHPTVASNAHLRLNVLRETIFDNIRREANDYLAIMRRLIELIHDGDSTEVVLENILRVENFADIQRASEAHIGSGYQGVVEILRIFESYARKNHDSFKQKYSRSTSKKQSKSSKRSEKKQAVVKDSQWNEYLFANGIGTFALLSLVYFFNLFLRNKKRQENGVKVKAVEAKSFLDILIPQWREAVKVIKTSWESIERIRNVSWTTMSSRFPPTSCVPSKRESNASFQDITFLIDETIESKKTNRNAEKTSRLREKKAKVFVRKSECHTKSASNSTKSILVLDAKVVSHPLDDVSSPFLNKDIVTSPCTPELTVSSHKTYDCIHSTCPSEASDGLNHDAFNFDDGPENEWVAVSSSSRHQKHKASVASNSKSESKYTQSYMESPRKNAKKYLDLRPSVKDLKSQSSSNSKEQQATSIAQTKLMPNSANHPLSNSVKRKVQLNLNNNNNSQPPHHDRTQIQNNCSNSSRRSESMSGGNDDVDLLSLTDSESSSGNENLRNSSNTYPDAVELSDEHNAVYHPISYGAVPAGEYAQTNIENSSDYQVMYCQDGSVPFNYPQPPYPYPPYFPHYVDPNLIVYQDSYQLYALPGYSEQVVYDPAALLDVIRRQIEYYFSEVNLIRDTYLRSLMDHDGYVKLSEIYTFRRIKKLQATPGMLLGAVRLSSSLDLCESWAIKAAVIEQDNLESLPPDAVLQCRVRCSLNPLQWVNSP